MPQTFIAAAEKLSTQLNSKTSRRTCRAIFDRPVGRARIDDDDFIEQSAHRSMQPGRFFSSFFDNEARGKGL